MNTTSYEPPSAQVADFLSGGGEMERRIRAFDWTRTALGPLEGWPQSLKTALTIALNSRYPIWMGWGWDLINLYNDPYIPILGKRDEWALGASAREVWKEIWEGQLGPQADSVLLRGEASWNDQRQLVMYRNGYAEETYFTFSFSPLPADGGGVGGLFCTCTEDTQKVLGERRLAALRHLAAATADARAEHDAATVAAQVLAEHGNDVAFALIYLIDASGGEARLAAATSHAAGARWAPHVISLKYAGEDTDPWPLARAREQGMQVLRDLDPARALPGGIWPEPAGTAAIVPLAKAGHARARGFLVVGASPRLPFDHNYESFFELLARGVADALSNARAYEEERQRAEALAELDRAKTAFFSNISHEFRTPLTLMLGPVEDMLAPAYGGLRAAAREQLGVVHRNSLRLLRLVNTMLDFSRIEAGRITARYEPVDLPAYTAELASNFRSACERAGLRLLIDCPPLQAAEPAFVDREMWEKIVLNLVSNALKFTHEGAIEVRLEPADANAVRLVVRDTGVGIPESELPHMFERFHRVDNARGRTHEGTGIGLALVHELVKLHGGAVGVESRLGEGTSFFVTIPLGNAHLSRERVQPANPTGGRSSAYAFVEEALRWLPGCTERDESVLRSGLLAIDRDQPAIVPSGARPRVLWADDNADMRDYVARLLSERYEVEAVGDGCSALESARLRPPDLVLTDVMMPHLDGFGLLRELRSDPALCDIPVIMLSARAGEESRIEGVEAGADDYLIKPFSARELVARVDAHVRLTRLRRETERVRRESREQVDRANAELTRRIAELERANAEVQAARTAALKLMDDALKANEALQRQSSRFETLLNNAPLGVYLVDADFRICEVNPVALPVFGDIPGGVVGRDFGEIMHMMWEETYADEIVRISRNTLETGEPYFAPERTEYRADRQIIEHYEWRLDRIVLPDGRHGLVCYFRDISQQVTARRELQEADRRKDEFLATLAHELRNPLAPIRQAARIANSPNASEAQMRWSNSVIERQVEHMSLLLDDLLDVSRITRGKLELRREPVQLRSVLEAAVETARPAIDTRRHVLSVELPEQDIVLHADPLRLAQVFSNLLTNAAKYTDKGGHIRLSALRDGGQLLVRVRDNGIGIAPESLSGLFAMFAQVKSALERSEGGLGIGLALAKGLVELHGGTIAAQSAGPGRGSEFTVRLPLGAATADASRRPASPPLSAAAAGAGRRILVVDDNRDAAESLAMLLRLHGHSVEIAHDGEEALARAAQSQPETVLLDIGMPRLNGYEVAQRMRMEPWGRAATLVAVTGWGQAEHKARAQAAGFDHHLTKPVDPDQVLSLLPGSAAEHVGH